MPVELSDSEIAELIEEEKVLPVDFRQRLKRMLDRGKHRRVNLEIQGVNEGRFMIKLRQNILDPFDFSAILGYQLPLSKTVFRLQRYNGPAHRHTNRIEGVTFRDFHIHKATERYQKRGGREDSFAEKTDRFSSLDSAVECLLLDCCCKVPKDNNQASLFLSGD